MKNEKRTIKTKSGKRDRSSLVEVGSGNVFADLGFENPDEALAKAELVQRIRDVMSARSLSQAQAAKMLGTDQPKISKLIRGQVQHYTLDRLLRYLTKLGQTIEIRVRTPAIGRSDESSLRVILA